MGHLQLYKDKVINGQQLHEEGRGLWIEHAWTLTSHNIFSLNFIRLLRVVITPSVTSLLRGENDSKQSDEFQVKLYIFLK